MKSEVDVVSVFSTKMLKVYSLCFIVFLLSSCSSGPNTTVRYNKEVNFLEYRKFSWHPLLAVESKGFYSEFSQNQQAQIKREVEKLFIKKGYSATPDYENADFILKVTIGKRSQRDIQIVKTPTYNEVAAYTTSGPRRRFEIQRGVYVSTGYETTEIVNDYAEGSFSIDVYDNSTNSPVWSGHIQTEIDLTIHPEVRRERLRIAAEKMLEQFPSHTSAIKQ